jgi:hypothetical protein
LRLQPAINPRLACFPLALFVWVHSARYVKRLVSTLSMAAVLGSDGLTALLVIMTGLRAIR